MDEFVISYDPHIDIVNMELFDRYGTSMPRQLRHRCVVCRQPVCIENSFSNGGRRMLCDACYFKLFKNDILKAQIWMNKF